jgi:hypothetical protein
VFVAEYSRVVEAVLRSIRVVRLFLEAYRPCREPLRIAVVVEPAPWFRLVTV